MRSLLLRCYPARWRARYGDEFEAILVERPLGPFDVADILLGALDAQLRSRGRRVDIKQAGGFSMSLRIGGIAAIFGAGLMAAAAIVGSGVVGIVDPLPSVLVTGASLVLLLAIAGLSAFQARAHALMTWMAFAIPTLGTLICIVGISGVFDANGSWEVSWSLVMAGLLLGLVGYALFAIVTYWTAVLSRSGALLLLIGPAISLVVLVTQTLAIPTGVPDFVAGASAVVAAGGFVLGWFTLGVQAIRLDRPVTEPRVA